MTVSNRFPAWRAMLVGALVALIAAATLATVATAPADAAAKGEARAERAVKRAVVHRYGVGTKVHVNCAKTGRRYSCGFAARRRGNSSTALVGQAKVSRRFRVRLGRVAKIG